MKLHFIKANLQQINISLLLVLWFFMFCMAPTMLVIFVGTAHAFHPREQTLVILSRLDSQSGLLPTALVSPTATNPASTSETASSQNSQPQNDISVVSTFVTLAGVVIALAGLVLTFLTIGGAIAGFFGVREFRRIRKVRKTITRLQEIQEQLERAISELSVNLRSFKDQFTKLTNDKVDIEYRIAQLKKDVENRRILEASYYFSEGTKAYRQGDNQHAVEYYKKALDLQQDSPYILERLGRAYSNLEQINDAKDCLQRALEIDDKYIPALRSSALFYRKTDPTKAIGFLERARTINPSDNEVWDFLGLLYRDQGHIKNAITAHEEALKIKRRPETEFFLSILLLYSPEGDKIRARELMTSASKRIFESENDQRIRPVWKILIQTGIPIIDGNKKDAIELIQSLTQYITTPRIHEAVQGHLQFLLEGTDHKEWIPEFTGIVKLRET